MSPPPPDSRRISLDSQASSYRSSPGKTKTPHSPVKHGHGSFESDKQTGKPGHNQHLPGKLGNFLRASYSSTSTAASASSDAHHHHPKQSAQTVVKKAFKDDTKRNSVDSSRSPDPKRKTRLSADSHASHSSKSPAKKVSTKPLRMGGQLHAQHDPHQAKKSPRRSVDPMLNPVVKSYSTTSNIKTDDFVVHYNRSTHSRITVDPNHEKFYETHGYPAKPRYHHHERRFSDSSMSDEEFDMELFAKLREELNERRRRSKAERRRRRRLERGEDDEEEEDEDAAKSARKSFKPPHDDIHISLQEFFEFLCCCGRVHDHNDYKNKVNDADAAKRKSTAQGERKDAIAPADNPSAFPFGPY